MAYFLNAIYLLTLVLASPWLLYACLRMGKYREGLATRLLGLVPRRREQGGCIWLHAVSVGEINLLGPLIESLEREVGDGYEFVISTTTKTGYDLAQKRYAERSVFYCPRDFSWAVRTALARIRPSLFLLTETEIWPNMIRSQKDPREDFCGKRGKMERESQASFSFRCLQISRGSKWLSRAMRCDRRTRKICSDANEWRGRLH